MPSRLAAATSLIPYGPLFEQLGLRHRNVYCRRLWLQLYRSSPLIDGTIVWDAVERLDVGGKLLTNYLKECLMQEGLAETIAASILLLPLDLQGMFWPNIGLIGGSTEIPSFRKRLCAR
ncbi:hypothetical protein DFH09DRAFT_270614 [Mycena vulgaris]|nr:hypothetical protein DFH09DRAFT_270614 [Mycena vulgaris]